MRCWHPRLCISSYPNRSILAVGLTPGETIVIRNQKHASVFVPSAMMRCFNSSCKHTTATPRPIGHVSHFMYPTLLCGWFRNPDASPDLFYSFGSQSFLVLIDLDLALHILDNLRGHQHLLGNF